MTLSGASVDYTKPIKANEFMDALDVALDLAEKRVSRTR